MSTFSDMAILLMAFFVIMLSFTEFDPQVYQKINGSMKFAFGVTTINLKMDIPTARSMMMDSFSPNISQTTITPTIRQRMETDGQLLVRKTEDSINRFDIEREFYILEAALEAEIEAGDVIVRIEDELLVVEVFETSSSEGSDAGETDFEAGVVSQKIINASAKVAQIQSEITREINVVATSTSPFDTNEVRTADVFDKLQVVRENLETEIDEGAVEVVMRDDEVLIIVDSQDAFASGRAELSPNFDILLAQIGSSISGLAESITVEGHTDNVPIGFQGRFNSNWDLSAARAASVAGVLSAQEGLELTNFEIIGFADTRPVASNETADGRSRNRRIEIKMSDFGDL